MLTMADADSMDSKLSPQLYVSIKCGKEKSFHCLTNQNVGDFVSQALKVNNEKIKTIFGSQKEGGDVTSAMPNMPAIMLVRDFGWKYLTVELEEDGAAESPIESSSTNVSAFDVLMRAQRSYDHIHLQRSYLAYEFDKFWVEEKPASIMEFNIYREKFHDKVKGFLLDPEVSLILKIESKNCPDD